MADNYLWSSSDRNTNFIDYIDYLKKNNLHNYSDYSSLHKWSVNNKEIFWKVLAKPFFARKCVFKVDMSSPS